MKQLMEYMVRHHDDLLKTPTDEQKEIFESLTIAGVNIRALPKYPYSSMPSNLAPGCPWKC